MFTNIVNASSNRIIGDLGIFESTNSNDWEMMYKSVINKKYAKGTRNFSRHPIMEKREEKGNIYLIPRERGGPSYKKVKLDKNSEEDVVFCPISKGFPMQDVSSFTLGPIVGEGLCLVNAAFSKSICVGHIEGGGEVDLKRKNFWKRSHNPTHDIKIINNSEMIVDGTQHDIFKWLQDHRQEWFEKWNLWRKSIALCSVGSFHWTDNLDETIAYFNKNQFVDFKTWKRECYIRPSYDLMPSTEPFKYIQQLYDSGKSIGLVHPMAIISHPQKPITPEFIRNLFDSNNEMCCQPFVVAAKVLGVDI